MNNESILDKAKNITSGDRMKDYGHPKKNFQDIADLWSSYLKMKDSAIKIDPTDVAHMMILLKISRNINKIKEDNIVDGAGYFRNIAQINEYE